MINLDEMIETLAETIIWVARERLKWGEGQNINSAICAVGLEIDQHLMEYMAEQNKVARQSKEGGY